MILTRDEVVERLEASVVALAADVDDPGTRPAARAMVARELRETLSVLKALAPIEKSSDAVDELTKRRNDRISASQTAVAP